MRSRHDRPSLYARLAATSSCFSLDDSLLHWGIHALLHLGRWGGGIHALLAWGRSGAGLTLPGYHTLDGFIVDLICLGFRSFHSLLVDAFILPL